MNANVWSVANLSQVAGIREIISSEVISSEENDPWDVPSHRSDPLQISMPGPTLRCDYPLRGEVTATLVDIYEQRIDPILKVIHMPSLRKSLLDKRWPDTVVQQAVLSAVQFSATCVLGEAECSERLGEQKSSLCQQFKMQTEALLSAADLYTDSGLTSLQAFVIYLVSVLNILWRV